MRIEESQQAAAARLGSGLPAAGRAAAAATPFASVLAEKAADKPGGAEGAGRKGQKGETTQAVKGHPGYVEITSGPRNGMFINTSGGPRDGEAFVRKRGAEFDLHIYGTGRDRQIVKVPHASAAKEQTKPIEQRPYEEITSGPRNGMYINRTNNERSGEAFVLVEKADRDLHIYGSGKDRRVIISWHKDQPAHADEYADGKPDGKADKTDKAEQPKAETGGLSGPKTKS